MQPLSHSLVRSMPHSLWQVDMTVLQVTFAPLSFQPKESCYCSSLERSLGSHNHPETLSWVPGPQSISVDSSGHCHHPGLHPRVPGKEEVQKGVRLPSCSIKDFSFPGQMLLIYHLCQRFSAEDLLVKQGVLAWDILLVDVCCRIWFYGSDV